LLIQPGDNLSKISNLFYGAPNKYEVIARANNLADPNKIHSGEALKIPLL
jgi:nucleoid-associated protein YgaU